MREAFRKRLESGVLLFDGAMGTLFYQRGVHLGRCFDAINLEDPDLVSQAHMDYRRAGAQVLQTNTFGANRFKLGRHHIAEQVDAINRRGAELARNVAGADLMVAGSIGPLGVKLEPWGPTSKDEAREAFREQAASLAAGGVDLFILETFADPSELLEAMKGAREASPDRPIIAQMTLTDEGRTLYGAPIEEVLPFIEGAGPDAIGLNCTVGPEVMLEALEKAMPAVSLPFSVQPNAGFPKRMEERYFYLSSPDYFAKYGKQFVEAGVRILGGCCGTTPEHIKALGRVLRAVHPVGRSSKVASVHPVSADEPAVELVPMAEKSRLARKLSEGRKIACVELLPPRGWGLARLLELTREMEAAGFDAVNIPDGPRATARLSPLATAVRIEQESQGIEAVLHYVCRDRNLLGMQADILGAYALGLRNLLLITGDPPVKGDYPEATPVFDVDAIGLTNLVHTLNHGRDVGGRSIGKPTGFLIGVGANPTAINFQREVERFYWKVDAGAEYGVTQPIFDLEAVDRFLDAIRDFAVPIVAGIWPLQSLRNAEFLNNEVPGVEIPAPIMERMRKVAGHPEAEREEGLQIGLEMARQLMPRVAGFQISAPFNRGESAKGLLDQLRPAMDGAKAGGA